MNQVEKKKKKAKPSQPYVIKIMSYVTVLERIRLVV